MKSEIKKTDLKIKELELELARWEEYNNIVNNITRDEIKSLKKYKNKLQKYLKKLDLK
jgi:hypothetical protein